MTREDILRMAREAGFDVNKKDGAYEAFEDNGYYIQTDRVIKFAALVAAAERDKIQAGYERLAFLHTETMAELVRVQRHLNCISANWWELLKHRIKTILGIKAKEDT